MVYIVNLVRLHGVILGAREIIPKMLDYSFT